MKIEFDNDSYEKDGRKIYTTDIVAERVEFLTHKESRNEPVGFEQVEEEIPW